jgi:hypothetical protein
MTLLLSGCSAGQVTQTATQARDKTGGLGQVGDIAIRAVRLAYPSDGLYRPGDEAELRMALVNSGTTDDALLSIAGDFFTGVAVGVPSSQTPPPAGSPSEAGATRPPTGHAPTTPNPSFTDAVKIPLPAEEAVFIGTSGPTVTLTGLTRSIDAAQSVQVTLTFAKAGQTAVTAIVDTPPRPLPRRPVTDF